MKLALFQKDAEVVPGIITERGIVEIGDLVRRAATPQQTMTGIIDGRLASYRFPFVWRAGWHKISTNETAFVLTHSC